jgi:hypothetical protein
LYYIASDKFTGGIKRRILTPEAMNALRNANSDLAQQVGLHHDTKWNRSKSRPTEVSKNKKGLIEKGS